LLARGRGNLQVKHEEKKPSVLPDSSKSINHSSSSLRLKERRIFQVDEGHRSRKTAIKYRLDFNLFLNFVKIYDLDVLLDLGKEAIQELVINYA
jgi:hypothetical protein